MSWLEFLQFLSFFATVLLKNKKENILDKKFF